jgi:hypothetical protein
VAQIPSNLFKQWKEGDVVHAIDYQLERDTLKNANNDTDSNVTAVTTRVTVAEGNIATNTQNIANLQTSKTDVTGDHNGTWKGLKPTDFTGGAQALALGDLTKLSTTAKDNLVNSINEVNGKVNAIKPDPYFTWSYWMSL